VQATWTCKRCGGFMCEACERRVRPDAVPLCPGCWSLRGQRVPAPQAARRLENAGLWLGGLSLTCLPPVMMASLVVNLIALSRAEPGARRKPLIGLGLTAAGIAVGVVVLIVTSLSR
jgi:hypothetical protein